MSRRSRARVSIPAPEEPASPKPQTPPPRPANPPAESSPQAPQTSFFQPVSRPSVDPSLVEGLQKIAEEANSVSTFEQFLNPADRAALDASRPLPQGPPRTPEDEQAIRTIKSYREEFTPKELPLPEDAELDQMTSEQLQDVVKRCRGGVARGVSKGMITSTYFSLTGMAEAYAPAYGWHLEGMTQALKQSKDVDDCLRCAYAEARAQVTSSLPWFFLLPVVTAQTAIAVHYGHEAELAARRLLDRPAKKVPRVNNEQTKTETVPGRPSPPRPFPDQPADSRPADLARESRPDANSGVQRQWENNISQALAPVC